MPLDTPTYLLANPPFYLVHRTVHNLKNSEIYQYKYDISWLSLIITHAEATSGINLQFYSHYLVLTLEIPPHINTIGPIVSISPHEREKMDIQNWNLDHKTVAFRKTCR